MTDLYFEQSPDLDGIDLAKKLRAKSAALGIFLATDDLAQEADPKVFNGKIEKEPKTLEELLGLVKKG